MVAKLRDGSILTVGERVSCLLKGCRDHVFIIEKISKFDCCESGTLVLVHLEEDPSRKINSKVKKDMKMPPGIDANWFMATTKKLDNAKD